MIEKDSLLTLPFYNKTSFTGSYHGMRYKITKEILDDDKTNKTSIFKVYVFPGPFAFDATKKEKMIVNQFEFSNQGLFKVCDWLNETYLKNLDLWNVSYL